RGGGTGKGTYRPVFRHPHPASDAAGQAGLIHPTRGRQAPGSNALPQAHRVHVLSGSLALAGGIWAMHFIGMLAVRLPVAVSFHGGFTLLSFLPALLASVVAVQVLARPQRSPALIATLPALP